MIFMEAEQLRLVLGAASAGLRGDGECPGAAVGASCQLLVGTYTPVENGPHPSSVRRPLLLGLCVWFLHTHPLEG